MYINLQEFVTINDTKQFISVRAEKQHAPLLLYLHGGPGDAALPLVLKYNKALEKDFTVVIWEQCGAGKSYYPFNKDETLTIDTFVQDTQQLAAYLLRQFQQEKLFLVGHSWGSVIGLRFIMQYPQMVYCYIGCGQVVNMRKSSELAYQYVLNQAIYQQNKKMMRRLRDIDPTYASSTWLKDLLFVTKQVVKYKGSLFGKTSYQSFIWDFITSSSYRLPDLLYREKGSLQSLRYLWQELMLVNFENITSFDVPTILIGGRQDYHVSSILAEAYSRTITTPSKFYWFEKSSHFPQWSEADAFHRILLDTLQEQAIRCM